MKRTYTFRPRARLDLLEQFLYLADQAMAAVAERYFTAVERTCARLAEQPHSGTPYDSGTPRLEGMRRVPVSGFMAYLLFYIPRGRGIEVVRIFHGARDIENLFTLDPEETLTPAEAKKVHRGMKQIKEGRYTKRKLKSS
jgi:toxin ParE1/3/4